MSDIRQWLDDLGLGQYTDAFEENEIGIGLLPDVTDEDLRNIGIEIAGHRVKLRRAIAALVGGTPSQMPAPEPSQVTDALPTVPEAERRQLTVMFCDLVGSTALSEKLDPEDLRGVMQGYRKACSDVIGRYDGHVAQYLGDGVMVYFGWPAAHEDDAQRAVRAGLEIVDAVASLEVNSPLQVRVGIATGLVVVGESGAESELAVGETPNVAARVQALAEPGSVAIAENTRRLIGGTFTLEDMGVQDAKGVSGGLTLNRVLGESATESRFEAHASAGLTPLVGREAEVAMLVERWDQAKEDEGQVVLLSGEPGIGKSRIIQMLRERAAEDQHVWLRYQCSPYYTNSAFYPIIDQIERAAGFARDDDPDAKLDKLETLLALSNGSAVDIAPLIAAMMSLPVSHYPPLNLSPQKQKENTILAIADGIIALSRSQPVLMIFEDAHWIDPTTLDALGAVIDRIQDSAVLLVITYRPEFEPPWSGHAHTTTLSLNRLSRRQVADMVANVTGEKTLPDEVLGHIVAKTDGVPLFVEELTKTVLESENLSEDPRRRIGDPLPSSTIPSTLQDSLMARLDRVPTVKYVAQLAAVIGRDFSFSLLAEIDPSTEAELAAALTEMVNAELIFQRGTPPDAKYTFKHALLQDAAYASLLNRKRKDLHQRIGETLEKLQFGPSDPEPELIAHHLTNAGLNDRALPYWQKAGEKALARDANKEAIAHLTNALDLLVTLPDGRDRATIELELRLDLGPAQQSTDGFASPEAGATYDSAYALSEFVGDGHQKFIATWGLWLNKQQRANFKIAERLSGELVVISERQGDSEFKLQANHAAWTSLLPRGEPARCYEHALKGISLYDRDAHHYHAHIYGGHDPGVCCRAHAAVSSWLLGYSDRSLPYLNEGLALAVDLDQPLTEMTIQIFGGYCFHFRREPEPVRQITEKAIYSAKKHQALQLVAIAQVVRGWALVADGLIKAGIEEIDKGISQYRATGARLRVAYFLSILAECCLTAGEFRRGLTVLGEAESISEANGEYWWRAEMLRLRGELLALSGSDMATVESSFQNALRVAGDQDARSLELRAATSLARLWRENGRYQEAYDLLTPVYDWFTEGFDTVDLRDAKALLDELG
jgi:class 3 adenylate cyclase/predicted ATPase